MDQEEEEVDLGDIFNISIAESEEQIPTGTLEEYLRNGFRDFIANEALFTETNVSGKAKLLKETTHFLGDLLVAINETQESERASLLQSISPEFSERLSSFQASCYAVRVRDDKDSIETITQDVNNWKTFHLNVWLCILHTVKITCLLKPSERFVPADSLYEALVCVVDKKTPVSKYSQRQLYFALGCLSTKWLSLNVSHIDAITTYARALEERLCDICLFSNKRDVVDIERMSSRIGEEYVVKEEFTVYCEEILREIGKELTFNRMMIGEYRCRPSFADCNAKQAVASALGISENDAEGKIECCRDAIKQFFDKLGDVLITERIENEIIEAHFLPGDSLRSTRGLFSQLQSSRKAVLSSFDKSTTRAANHLHEYSRTTCSSVRESLDQFKLALFRVAVDARIPAKGGNHIGEGSYLPLFCNTEKIAQGKAPSVMRNLKNEDIIGSKKMFPVSEEIIPPFRQAIFGFFCETRLENGKFGDEFVFDARKSVFRQQFDAKIGDFLVGMPKAKHPMIIYLLGGVLGVYFFDVGEMRKMCRERGTEEALRFTEGCQKRFYKTCDEAATFCLWALLMKEFFPSQRVLSVVKEISKQQTKK